MKTFDLLGTPLVATSYEELIRQVHDFARSGGPRAVDLTNKADKESAGRHSLPASKA